MCYFNNKGNLIMDNGKSIENVFNKIQLTSKEAKEMDEKTVSFLDLFYLSKFIKKEVNERISHCASDRERFFSDQIMESRMNSLESFNNSLIENRNEISKILSQANSDLTENIKTISANQIHKIVNGSLNELNRKMDKVTDYVEENKVVIPEIKEKVKDVEIHTFYGAIRSGLKEKPIRTSIIIFFVVFTIALLLLNTAYHVFYSEEGGVLKFLESIWNIIKGAF